MKKTRDGRMPLPDPLYKFIYVDEEIYNFIVRDPLFNEDRERVKQITNLGLVRYFFPSASHSKWEHHLGTYHLISECEKYSRYLDRNEFRLLRYLNFFSCFGYPALGYCSAEAILVAAEKSATVQKELLDKYLNPVFEEAETHASAHPEYRIRDKPEDLLKKYRYKALNSWFGAFKLLNIDVKKLPKRLWKKELCAALVSDSCRVKRAYFELARLEYLQRDLFYTQIVSFNIPIERAVGDYKKQILGDTYSELLEALRATITREVYTHPGFLTLETLAREAIADALVSEKIKIADLIEKDDQWLQEQISAKDLFPPIDRGEEILRETTMLDMAHINHADKDYQSRRELVSGIHGTLPPGKCGYVVSGAIEQRSFSIAYNKFRALDVVVFAHSRPQLAQLLRSLNELAMLYVNTKRANGINVNTFLHRYSREVLEYGFQCRVKIGFDNLYKELQELYKATSIPKKLSDFLDRVRKSNSSDHQILSSHDHTNKTIMNGRRFSFLLEYIANGGVNAALSRELAETLQELVRALTCPGAIATEGVKMERLALLYLLKEFPPDKHVICPAVELLNVEGDRTNEVDFIVLSAMSPQVRLVECTISDGEEKARSDARKLTKLTGQLKNRYDDINIQTVLIGDGMEKLRDEGLCDQYLDAKIVK